jgi:hypothetical protein
MSEYFRDLALLGGELADDFFREELRAFAQRRQGRFELV